MQTQFNELTDAQWGVICTFLPLERKRKHNLRTVLDRIFHLNRTGTQWRNLIPKDSTFPCWQVIYYYFNVWTKLGIIANINLELVKLERVRQGKNTQPSAVTIDSQSVKIAPFMPDDKGFDSNKKMNGRKRHIITDTLGLIIGVSVSSAKVHDGVFGCSLFKNTIDKFKTIKCIFADHSYKGSFSEMVEKNTLKIEIAAKPESSKGFIPVKIRWVVERTFGWLNFFRRHSKDYERKTQNAESMIYLSQIQIILNRIT